MFAIYSQHIDITSGFHVVELRDGSRKHIVQIAIGHDACPACGHAHAKDIDQLDPKAMVAAVIEELDKSHSGMMAYAERHGLQVK